MSALFSKFLLPILIKLVFRMSLDLAWEDKCLSPHSLPGRSPPATESDSDEKASAAPSLSGDSPVAAIAPQPMDLDDMIAVRTRLLMLDNLRLIIVFKGFISTNNTGPS